MRAVHRSRGAAVLRPRIASLLAPYLISMPGDLVPPPVLQRLAAPGVRVR